MKPSKITAAILALSIASSAMPAFEVSAADAVTTTTAKVAATTTTTVQTTTAAKQTTTATTAKAAAKTTAKTTAQTTAKTTAATTTKTAVTTADKQEHLVYDEATGTLTLHGDFTSSEIRSFRYAGKVQSIIAAEDAVFPENCSNIFYFCNKLRRRFHG